VVRPLEEVKVLPEELEVLAVREEPLARADLEVVEPLIPTSPGMDVRTPRRDARAIRARMVARENLVSRHRSGLRRREGSASLHGQMDASSFAS
jgi:hypothetical protein